jgi:hypothetical protein
VQDTGKGSFGLDAVDTNGSINVNITVEPDPSDWDLFHYDPVTITATPIDPSKVATLKVKATDNLGNAKSCSATLLPEKVIPVCGISITSESEAVASIIDTGSGLKYPLTIRTRNATTSVDPDPFDDGYTDTVTVTATKDDQSKSAHLTVIAFDMAGNRIKCDPVLTHMKITNGKKVKQTFTDIPVQEHFITLQNGAPGLNKLVAVVNGTKFKLLNLQDNEVHTLDVAAAMIAEGNTIKLQGRGKAGDSAVVMIADVPVDAATFAEMLKSSSSVNMTWGNLVK